MCNTRMAFALGILLISVTACDIPISQPGTADPGLTTEALQRASPTVTAAIPITGGTGTPAGTLLTVNSPTTCRTGPGNTYDPVFAVGPGQSFRVIGKYTPGDYWIVMYPAGGTCWLPGKHGFITGDTVSLPEYPAPPASAKPAGSPEAIPTTTSTPVAASSTSDIPGLPILTLVVPIVPAAPSNLVASRTCAGGFKGFTPIWVEDVTLSWTDSPNDAGYHVYQNDSLISTLATDSTSFHIQLRYNQSIGGSRSDTFGVEAFNEARASARLTLDVPGCP